MARRMIGLLLAGVIACTGLTACSTAAPSTSDTQVLQNTVQVTSAGTDATNATNIDSTATATNAAAVLAENVVADTLDISAAESANAIQIVLNGSSIAVDGSGVAVDGSGVTVDGSTATITSAGTYRLSGTLADGQIVVDSNDDAPVVLILDGVNISSSTSTPLYVRSAEAVALILADNTANVLSDGDAYVYASADEDEPNAALFSDADLSIAGTGTLTVNARYNDGIASKDGLSITGGTISVTAADDGIRGKDYLIVTGGTITVNAGGDGLLADNDEDATKGYVSIAGGTLDITAGGDGVQATTDLVVTDGELHIVAGGGSGATLAADQSAKGLKAGESLALDGGSFVINAADDGLHSDGTMTINGGTFSIATGDDGMHAETSLTVTGGDIQIDEAYEGIESADITISGGRVAIVASDDGVNAAGGTGTEASAAPPQGGMPGQGGPMSGGNFKLTVSGGTLLVEAGGDGIDANGSITMSGGLVIVNGPTEQMNGALDYDSSFTISGGTLVAVGSAGMVAAPDANSTQNVLQLTLNAVQPAGTLVHIQNSAGDTILTFAPNKAYQSLVFTSSALKAGETYEVSLGGTATGNAVDGVFSDGAYTGGSVYTSFTVSSVVTQIGGGGGRFR